MSYSHPTEQEAADRRAGLAPFDEYNIRALLAVYALLGIPVTHLDLGSGSGAMVKAARRLGVDAVGVDVIAEAPDVAWDLTRPLQLGRRFTIVTCIEVAEHLPPEAARTLCQTAAQHLAPRGWLIFTSALPGQAGEHHVNLVPPFDWRGWMWEAGLAWSPEVTSRLALLWSHTSGNLHHLPANLQCFTTREGW